MDPLTHGMIGLALSTFSGQAVSLSNPITIGCAIGAIIPDIDSVIRLYADDATYLKQHRGFSHSIPMLIVFSGIISFGIAWAMKVPLWTLDFWYLWLWSFFGALSHTLFDILNSYGAMLLRKKRKLNLLTLYDPVITALGLTLIFQPRVVWWWHVVAALIFGGYMYYRHVNRQGAARALEGADFFEGQVVNIAVLPSLTAFYRWDFIVETSRYTYVGKYNQWNKKTRIIERLDAQCPSMREAFDRTNLGAYFNDFSPYLHIVHTENDSDVTLRVVDLRYYVRNRFLHQATLVLRSQDLQVLSSVLHPYGQNRSVAFDES